MTEYGLVTICVAVLAFVGALFLLPYFVLKRKISDLQDQIIQLKQQQKVTNRRNKTIGHKLISFEGQIHQLEDKQEDILEDNQDKSVYSQATKMLELGASIDDVIAACQLSRPEVELLALIYNS